VHRTSLARAPLSRGAAARDGTVRQFNGALQAEIREEEKDVLYLEDLLDRARLDAMQELGKELAASRRELARLAEKLRKARTRTPSASCWRKWIACGSASRTSCRACRSSPRGSRTST